MNILKGKSTRTKIFTVVTLLLLVALIILNFGVTKLVLDNTLFLDLTYEGFYTLTDRMQEECEFTDGLDGTIEIIFCDDPDRLISQTVTRLVYFMSVMLDNKFENVETRTVNVALNPTAVAEYRTTSLSEITSTDIIVSYGSRYRVVNAEAFWHRNTSDGGLFSYDGEYKMASLFKSVTAFSASGAASAYFLTDHGETFYDETRPDENTELLNFYYALEDAGLNVKHIKLSDVEAIPEDCALLIINNPTEDFLPDEDRLDEFNYVSPLEKIDRYLVASYGSVMIAKDFEAELPLLETYLHEWGFNFENVIVKDEKQSIEDTLESNTQLISDYNTDENDYGMGVYSEFASVVSAPKFVVTNSGYMTCSFKNSDYQYENGAHGITRTYSSFLSSSANAKAYVKTAEGDYELYANEGAKDLVGVSTRMALDSYTNRNKYSYVICANSEDFLSNGFIANSAYSNYDVFVSLARNVTRTDDYASVDLGGTSENSSSFGGKMLLEDTISTVSGDYYYKSTDEPLKYNYGLTTPETVLYSIIIFAVPVIIAAVGIVVKVKRKYL